MKASYQTQAEIPEAFRGEYEERGGKFVLKMEGEHPGFVTVAEHNATEAKLDEFRTNNRNLKKDRDDAVARLDGYKDIDPVKYKEAVQKLDELQKQGLGSPAEAQAFYKKQIQEIVGPLEQKLKETEEREAKKTADLRRTRVESLLREEGMKQGVDPRAMEDFIARGTRIFSIGEDDKLVAKNGETPLMSKTDRGETLGVSEWVSSLIPEFPYYFKPSNGGGAEGGGGKNRPVPAKTIAADDDRAFSANIEDIAAGKVRVGA